MKSFNLKTIAAIVIAGAFSIGNANAIDKSFPLTSVVGLTGSHVTVTVEDGVARLFGTVESGVDSRLAESHVAELEGIREVTNSIIIN